MYILQHHKSQNMNSEDWTGAQVEIAQHNTSTGMRTPGTQHATGMKVYQKVTDIVTTQILTQQKVIKDPGI